MLVVGDESSIRGDDRVDDVGELEFDWRQVVEGAQDHAQEVAGGLRALLGDAVGVEPALLAVQWIEALGPHADERLKERRDKDFRASMRLPVGRIGFPVRVRGEIDGSSKGRIVTRRRRLATIAHRTDLLRETHQWRFLQVVGAAFPQLLRALPRVVGGGVGIGRELDLAVGRLEQSLGRAVQGEDGEQGDQIGERLVERQLVG